MDLLNLMNVTTGGGYKITNFWNLRADRAAVLEQIRQKFDDVVTLFRNRILDLIGRHYLDLIDRYYLDLITVPCTRFKKNQVQAFHKRG